MTRLYVPTEIMRTAGVEHAAPSSGASRHLLPQGEKEGAGSFRFDGLLPLWEKVPEGRMRGRPFARNIEE